MISKELLSEVLGKDILSARIEGKSAIYTVDYETEEDGELTWIIAEFFINIYELANKCKEWALSKKFQLHSGIHTIARPKEEYYNKKSSDFNKCIRESYWFAKLKSSIYVTTKLCQHESSSDFLVYGASEPEAIFKACQWILDNRKEEAGK